MKKNILILLFSLCSWSWPQEAVRFMVVGDVHHYSPAADFRQTNLYEFVLAAINEQVDFIFLCGDLVIQGFGEYSEKDSVLKDWRTALQMLEANQIKMYACRGNNDGSRESWDSLFCGDYAFPPNGPAGEKNLTYTIEYENILFIALDQYSEAHKINQVWLDSVLSTNKSTHIFAAGHEPAFKLLHSYCLDAFPEERNQFWESLTQAGVKIFFCGHDHFYDHTILDDGDGDERNDAHQVIVGTGSHPHGDSDYDGDNGRWTPLRLFHADSNGYALVEAGKSEVKLNWKQRAEQNVFVDGGDSYRFVTSVEKKLDGVQDYQLFQNYPNPFNPTTTIEFALPKSAFVTLKVYNLLGEEVATLIAEQRAAGIHKFNWDAKGLAGGVYL